MTPPPPGYPSAPPGPTFDEAPDTPPSGTSMDNNNNGPLAPSMAPPPGRSAAPPPVGIARLQGKKGLLTVATGIMLFLYAMTAATAIGTSNRMPDLKCSWNVQQEVAECIRERKECDWEALSQKEKDCGTVPVSYFGGWHKTEVSGKRRRRDYGGYTPGRRQYHKRPQTPSPSRPETETEWKYVEKAAVLVHFWMFALSDLPSAFVAIFVLANIAIFRRALFYFIAMIVLAICFLVYLVAPIVITATTLSAITGESNQLRWVLDKDVAPTIKEGLAYDCEEKKIFDDVDYCKTRQSWEITAIVLMWLFGLVSAVLRAGYLFLLFQAWKKQKNNGGDSVR
ncbi:hypothetical protein AAVH_16469 [Aphelenchoides avenae]|nr:hypothetical protein AAVH_16469 [Aphelenchus avenae]